MKAYRPKILFRALLLIGTNLMSLAEVPQGWIRAGSKPKDYEMSLDSSILHGGRHSACLKSTVSNPNGFGTLMQQFDAENFRGKRVRLSGFVRSHEVTGWAGLWMRVDGKDRKVLAFDNMYRRAIKGTSDWRNYEVVLDVPDTSEVISFGLLLDGAGQVWMDDLKFEAVGEDVGTTDGKPSVVLPKSPKLEIP